MLCSNIKSLILLIAILSVMGFSAADAVAQNRLIRDYFRDYDIVAPRVYSPDDPFQMGKILRWEVGHGRLFYNCDSEESKRQSPYINWNQQNTDCHHQKPVRCTINQQLEEIKQRVRWGSCQECGNSGGHCDCSICNSGSEFGAAKQIKEHPTLQAANQVWNRAIKRPATTIPSSGLSDSAEAQVAKNRQKVEALLVQSRKAANATTPKAVASARASSRRGLIAEARNEVAAERESSRSTVAQLLQQARSSRANELEGPAPTERIRQAIRPRVPQPKTEPKQQQPVRSDSTVRQHLGSSRVIPRKSPTGNARSATKATIARAVQEPKPISKATSRTTRNARTANAAAKSSNKSQTFLSKLLASPNQKATSGSGMGVTRKAPEAKTQPSAPTRQAERTSSSEDSFRMLRR